MNRTGHTWGAICFAPVPVTTFYPEKPYLAALALLGCLSGACAPDYLEFRIIPHRTITHTLSLWLSVALCGLLTALGEPPAVFTHINATSPETGAIIYGFGCGCVAHWLGDVLNLNGVPVLTPFDKVSLGLFRSGTRQYISCGFIALVACTILYLIEATS